MPFIIKKLKPKDIALAQQLFTFFQVDDGVKEPEIPTEDYLKTLLSRGDFHVVVAMQDDQLTGGLTAFELPMYKKEIREMFLYEIAVEPAYRQMGIAKALIDFLKEVALAKGMKEMYVGTTSDNTAAVKLYKATGADAEADVLWFVYQLVNGEG